MNEDIIRTSLRENLAMPDGIVGTRIAEGRKSKNMSQAKFAELLAVTPQAVGKWERGESLPDVITLGRIGTVIGNTDLNYFLGKNPCACSCGCCDCCKN